MKKSKKILFVTISIISLIILFNINSYAVSQSNNTANNQSTNTSNTAKNNSSISTDTTSNKSKNENTQKTTSTTNKKSSNANLSNLGIKPNDFSGFKPTITTYNVTVSEDVEEINVYATPQDSKATVSGTGKKQLESEKNTVSVVVTAEDGTSKTYTININKSENAKNSTKIDNQDGSKGLSELKIEGLTLEPEFSTNTYEYTTKYIGEDTKLNISAVATDSKFVVEVTGNEELKEGENIITILVSDSDGENVATYQVIVNKSLVDEEAVQKEQAEKRKKIIIASVVGIIIIILIIAFIIRYRRNRYYEDEEDWEEDHNDLFPEDNINEGYDEEKTNYEEDTENDDIDFTEVKGKTEEEEKEALKRKFLENYNSNNYDDEYEEEPKPKRKRKGKRFK